MGLFDFLSNGKVKELLEENANLQRKVAELLEKIDELHHENAHLRSRVDECHTESTDENNADSAEKAEDADVNNADHAEDADSAEKAEDADEYNADSAEKETRIGAKIERHAGIDSRYLVQKLDGADPDNPFYGKKVVISGTFEQIGMERNEVAEKLQKLGAKIMRNVSPELDFFIIGNRPGPSKLAKIEGWQKEGIPIQVISQIELKVIFDVAAHR